MLCKQCNKIIESQKEGTSYFSVAEEKSSGLALLYESGSRDLL